MPQAEDATPRAPRAWLNTGMQLAALRALAVISMIGLPAACAHSDPKQPADEAWQALTQLASKSCSKDSECRVLAVGWRACGGPAQYLAWSVTDTDQAALQGAARHYTALQRKKAEASGEMSTCELLPVPVAHCKAPEQTASLKPSDRSPGQCSLREEAAGGLR